MRYGSQAVEARVRSATLHGLKATNIYASHPNATLSLQVLNTSSGRCWSSEAYNPCPVSSCTLTRSNSTLWTLTPILNGPCGMLQLQAGCDLIAGSAIKLTWMERRKKEQKKERKKQRLHFLGCMSRTTIVGHLVTDPKMEVGICKMFLVVESHSGFSSSS